MTIATLTLPQPISDNSTLVLVASLRDATLAALNSITQTGVVWEQALAVDDTDRRLEFWFAASPQGGAQTIDVDFTASHSQFIHVFEFYGIFALLGTPLDRVASDQGYGAIATTGTTENSTRPRILWIGALHSENSMAFFTPSNGFAPLASGNAGPHNFIVATKYTNQITANGFFIDQLFDYTWLGGVIGLFAEPPPGVLLLSQIEPTTVGEYGGYELTITGNFSASLGKAFSVHIGPAGDDTDPHAYSGKPGAPLTLYPRNAQTLVCYTPRLLPGTYNVHLLADDLTQQGLLVGALTVTQRVFNSTIYGMKAVLPTYYALGARQPENEV